MTPLVTIDARHSRDLDDAIAVERVEGRWRATVAIADVAGAVAFGSDDDLTARRRGATRYFATGNSAMLPVALAERRLSLLPRRPRRALVVRIDLSGDGLRERRVTLTNETIRTTARLAYDHIPRLLRGKGPVSVMLREASTLAAVLLDARRAAGALAIYDLNEGWLTTEDGQLKVCERREDTIGQIIVQELMILANAAVAERAIRTGLPLLFRTHGARPAAPSRDELLHEIEAARLAPSTGIELLRQRTHLLLERARYDAVARSHFGLNLPAYLHFTSPIRRYADLVNHHQLRAQILGERPPATAEMLAELAADLNGLEDEYRWLTTESYKLRAHEAARTHIAARRLDGLAAKPFERAVNAARTEAECEGFGPKAQLGADGVVQSFWPRTKKYDGQGCPKFSEGPR